MAAKSVYWPEPDIRGDLVHVTGAEHQHLRVGRAAPGEAVELFDGNGRVWSGEVVGGSRHETRVRILGERLVPPPEAEIVLGQALIRTSAFELVLEKAVEVGVTRIVPFRAGRSNEGGGERDVRWSKIVIEAAKQSKNYHLPGLDPVTDFEKLLRLEARSKLILAERSDEKLGPAVFGAPVLYLVGPEGGWTEGELEAARAAAFHRVGLGPHILRAETAAIVGAGLIAHRLGILG